MLSTSVATCKTLDARHVAKTLRARTTNMWMQQWITILCTDHKAVGCVAGGRAYRSKVTRMPPHTHPRPPSLAQMPPPGFESKWLAPHDGCHASHLTAVGSGPWAWAPALEKRMLSATSAARRETSCLGSLFGVVQWGSSTFGAVLQSRWLVQNLSFAGYTWVLEIHVWTESRPVRRRSPMI